ncbi:Sugar phosphate permease [Granulicella pectinivorans]|uniref:Sugar phosphate permease n=1 Tax=Granulicella pectinivorans TaxID=474950 RepID=A0A1I6LB91_9BACT|nr:MFS transporter [Granulicella pectinivorans]SFS00699.1 Sugar phosphate permease [Granulicella pectinivorans]
MASLLEKTSGKRIGIAVVLGVGVLVNYFDRVNLSVAHDALEHTFGISDVTFGWLLSSYSWTYAAMQIPCGSLLDRFGVRRVMIVAILLWALASGLATVAPTIVLLFAARFLLGIGEAPTFPANAKAVGLWFPSQERGVPTATFDAAAKLSIGLGTPILGLILLRYGLRANFATTAILSLAYAGLFAWVYRDPNPTESLQAAELEALPAEKVDFASLLRQPKVWGAALGSGAYNYCFYLLLTWLPFYLQRGLKMTAHNAVLWSAVPWLVAAAAGFGIGGMLVDRLIKRGVDPDTVRRSVLIGGTSCGLFVLAPAFLHEPRIVLLCLTIAISGLAAASPVVWTLPSLLAPPGATGRVGSLMNLANQIAGITAPIITGYISGWTHSFAGAFLLASIVLLCGIGSYIFLLGRIERMELAMA